MLHEGERVPITPQRLRAGDGLAAALSWGGPGTFPYRHEAGERQLEAAFGAEVVEMPHTLADAATQAADPAARAGDLHHAFTDPDIAGVISTIGGDDSIRLLPHLDVELVAANPKVFLGYADSTIIQMALLRAGITSFDGPSIMAGFGENAGLHDYLVDGVRRTLFDPVAPRTWLENRDGWTVEQPDWTDPTNRHRPRHLLPGTAWWPALDGVVLVLETSEDQPPPASITETYGDFRPATRYGDWQRFSPGRLS